MDGSTFHMPGGNLIEVGMNGNCAGNGSSECSLIARTRVDKTLCAVERIVNRIRECGKGEVKTALEPVNLLSAVSFEF